jgi:hypothetical protein
MLSHMKTKMLKIEQFFKSEEIGTLPGDYVGHLLILDPNLLKPEFRTRKNMVWRAQGGFGCDPTKMGRAVFATCVSDGEQARWDRGSFCAKFIGDEKSI